MQEICEGETITHRHALEKIGMPANKLVGLFLHNLGPDGRPEVAAGTNGHPVHRQSHSLVT
jgi:hypothetical protein